MAFRIDTAVEASADPQKKREFETAESGRSSGTGATADTEVSKQTAGRRKRSSKIRLARGFFYLHLWLGVVATALLVVISVTGILLNHKRELGLMPEVANEPSGALTDALPLSVLTLAATEALPPGVAATDVDRMDIRPDDGLIKIRFSHERVTEVTVDLYSGRVLHIGERHDQFLERLHSGEIFGATWVLLSDAGAILLLVIMVSGYWLWLFPKSRV